jgi:hypothetical protein
LHAALLQGLQLQGLQLQAQQHQVTVALPFPSCCQMTPAAAAPCLAGHSLALLLLLLLQVVSCHSLAHLLLVRLLLLVVVSCHNQAHHSRACHSQVTCLGQQQHKVPYLACLASPAALLLVPCPCHMAAAAAAAAVRGSQLRRRRCCCRLLLVAVPSSSQPDLQTRSPLSHLLLLTWQTKRQQQSRLREALTPAAAAAAAAGAAAACPCTQLHQALHHSCQVQQQRTA